MKPTPGQLVLIATAIALALILTACDANTATRVLRAAGAAVDRYNDAEDTAPAPVAAPPVYAQPAPYPYVITP